MISEDAATIVAGTVEAETLSLINAAGTVVGQLGLTTYLGYSDPVPALTLLHTDPLVTDSVLGWTTLPPGVSGQPYVFLLGPKLVADTSGNAPVVQLTSSAFGYQLYLAGGTPNVFTTRTPYLALNAVGTTATAVLQADQLQLTRSSRFGRFLVDSQLGRMTAGTQNATAANVNIPGAAITFTGLQVGDVVELDWTAYLDNISGVADRAWVGVNVSGVAAPVGIAESASVGTTALGQGASAHGQWVGTVTTAGSFTAQLFLQAGGAGNMRAIAIAAGIGTGTSIRGRAFSIQ